MRKGPIIPSFRVSLYLAQIPCFVNVVVYVSNVRLSLVGFQVQLYLVKRNKNGWRSNTTWLAQPGTATWAARPRAAPAGACAGLDSHMGSGVRGAAETR